MAIQLQTQDLVLKPSNIRFAGALHAYYEKNKAFLESFEPKRDAAFYTLERQEALLRKEMADIVKKTGIRFYIFPNEDPQAIIGSVALSNIVWGSFLSCFLGYKLDEEHRGRGYMPQAVQAVTGFAFQTMRLHRIESNIMPRNTASRRVLEKCGFQEEGISPKYLKINGVWEDHVHMVLLNGAL